MGSEFDADAAIKEANRMGWTAWVQILEAGRVPAKPECNHEWVSGKQINTNLWSVMCRKCGIESGNVGPEKKDTVEISREVAERWIDGNIADIALYNEIEQALGRAE